jgi:KEOPS complex subunit Cgi121
MQREIVEGILVVEDLQASLKEIRRLAASSNVIIQAMNADKLAGIAHIDLAMRKALRAFEERRNVARDPGVELMRYASGRRQITEAFSLGLSVGENRVVFVVMGEEQETVFGTAGILCGFVKGAQVLEYHLGKRAVLMEHFGIGEVEILAVGEAKLPELVLERVALVDVFK